MSSFFNRRAFLGSLALTGLASSSSAAAAVLPSHLIAPQQDNDTERRLDPKLVYAFVRTAHLNLDRTREMLAQEPRLIRATWEWSPGDFEMAIDGAAHSGSREIVEFLVDSGAPYSVFAAATLGDLATVKAVVDQHAEVATSTGAHGIPLIEHAIAGGQPAEEVVKLLSGLGAQPREAPQDLPTDPKYRQQLVGKYHLTADGRELDFEILVKDEQLFIDAGPLGVKRLQFQGQDLFQLEGTPAQLIFEIVDGRAVSAMLREGAPVGTARRVD